MYSTVTLFIFGAIFLVTGSAITDLGNLPTLAKSLFALGGLALAGGAGLGMFSYLTGPTDKKY